jgi:dTDP-4-dehydrorhamnose reductase
MVARSLVTHCNTLDDKVFAHDRQSLDITDEKAVADTLDQARPDAVINCAAWTDVDGCELDHERAYQANARGPEILAENCRRVGASLVTISTDYVFDGAKEGFYTQRDDPNPVSFYGRVKLEGERHAQNACARTSIVRTGWIFGAGGKNFLSRVVEFAQTGKPLKAIVDAYGTPTYAKDLAMRLRELAELDLPGIYHVTNAGAGTSFAEFTRTALRLARCEDAVALEEVHLNDLPRPAPRPRNSRLRCLISERLGLKPLPYWEDGLRDFLTVKI